MKRCEWANRSELERSYHDQEWGTPVHDDRHLFEFPVLEGAQAGLSWSTILRKREGYRKVFHHFDAQKISRFSEEDVSRLLAVSEIIRNRLKIEAAITNARAFLRVQEQRGGPPAQDGQEILVPSGTSVASSGTAPRIPGPSSLVAPNPADGPSEPPAVAPPAATGVREVEVRPGDTLFEISRREQGDPNLYYRLIKANPGIDPKRLRAGQKIKVPVE